MITQKFKSHMILCLLFLLGLVYSAHVFVIDRKVAVQTAITNTSDDNTESGEENVKETFHPLFLLEKIPDHLKPVTSIVVSLNHDIEAPLPEAYLQLSTPPPDLA